MPPTKLSALERLRLLERALQGENVEALAREYDVSRSLIYKLMDEARNDPDGWLAEAETRLKIHKLISRNTSS